MKRRVFNFVRAASLLLFLATAALWARSYWYVDVLGREGRESADHWQRGGYVSSGAGSLNVEWWFRQNAPPGSQTEPGWVHSSWPVRSPIPARPWHGFGYEAASFDSSRLRSDGRTTPKRMTYVHRVMTPHWFILLLAAAPSALWLREWAIRRRRLRENRCPVCGYDLRATPAAARSAG